MSKQDSIKIQRKCKTYIRRVSYVTELLQGKWKIQILCAMRSEPVRLSQLTRLIPSASKKALRASLRSLEAAQIVVRRDLSGIVLHVEYDFADDMRVTVCSLLDQLSQWGETLQGKDKVPDPSRPRTGVTDSLNSVERID
jgi:DNA-binding HxlR family transcriptional regulator